MAEATDRPVGTPDATAWPEPEPSGPGGGAYAPLSLLAIAGLALAVLYGLVVSLGGVVAFATRKPGLLLLLTVLTPLAAVVAALLKGIRQPGRIAALAGLALAALYALPVGLGGLVAFASHAPWLLPAWTLVLPLAALALCWAARTQIRAAEGTLGGAGLAAWGIGLSLFFGANYLAYFISSQLAVRQQAAGYADEFLTRVRQGKLERAFLLTLPVNRRPAEHNLRQALEVEHNFPSRPSEPGPFTAFCQRDFVRLMEQGGDATTFQLTSVPSWDFERGGYRVQLRYRVATPLADLDLLVSMVGTEGRDGSGGRQWHVNLNDTGQPRAPADNRPTLRLTAEGQEREQQIQQAHKVAAAWASQVTRGALDQAYLETLPPAEREQQHQARQNAAFLAVTAAGLPSLALAGVPGRAYLAGRNAFQQGNVLRVERFWADTAVRERLLNQVREGFRPDRRRIEVQVTSVRFPHTEKAAGRVRFFFDTTMLVPGAQGKPEYVVEGALVVERKDNDPDGWYVRAVELERGRTAPPDPLSAPGRGRGGPRG